jgi:hypothetical protein
MTEKGRQGMLRDSHMFTRKLTSQGARSHVALRADLQRDLAFREEIHEHPVLDGRDAVSDAFDFQQLNGFANSLRATYFARMNQPMQAKFCGPLVHRTKRRGLYLQLVSADAEGDDALGFTGLGGLHHFHRSRGAELPNRVKHPPKTKTAALEWLGGTKQSFKIGFRLLLSQKHDAHR